MKLGLVTAICDGMTFQEVVDFASSIGLECLEVACWPQGGAKRRYAGVSHIDAANLDEKGAEEICTYCREKGVEISSLAYYPNTLDPDLEKRKDYITHLYKLIDASALLGVNMVTTFVGRDPHKTVSENLELVKEVWPPIVKYAENKGVKIGIENCPMLFMEDEWPGGQNLMTTPAIWRKVFEIIDSKNFDFGINYDPSILYGSRLTISGRCMSLRIKFSMYITKISKFIGISWKMSALWQRLSNICRQSFRGLGT